DAIDRYRPFENHVAHDLSRGRDIQHMILPCPLPANNLSDPIDMAGNEMPAQAAIGPEGSLQVHQRAWLCELKVGAVPGFSQQIEPGQPKASSTPQRGYRQTTTVDRQAVANF